MVTFEFVTLLLCLIVQVKAITNAEVSSIAHKCSKKFPGAKTRFSSVLSECVLTEIKVLDSNGTINRNNLKNLLEIKYKDPTFVTKLVDLCGIQKTNMSDTAYFVFHSCWLAQYENINEAKNSIAFLSCWFPKYKTENEIKLAEAKIYKCFLESINIMDKYGKVNKESLLQLMKQDKSKEFDEKAILSCATEKKDPLETATKVWRCLNS